MRWRWGDRITANNLELGEKTVKQGFVNKSLGNQEKRAYFQCTPFPWVNIKEHDFTDSVSHFDRHVPCSCPVKTDRVEGPRLALTNVVLM